MKKGKTEHGKAPQGSAVSILHSYSLSMVGVTQRLTPNFRAHIKYKSSDVGLKMSEAR